MNGSDQLLKSLFNILLALFVVQIGLLFLLDQNQKKHVQTMNNRKPANAQISCGMYRNVILDEKFTYPEFINQSDSCKNSSCEISGYKSLNTESTSEEEVHIVSVHSGLQVKTQGGRRNQRTLPVTVKVKKTEKPVHLVLVNKDRMRWSLELEEGAVLSAITLASKSIAWIEGQPEDVAINYLPSSLMCSYPNSFRDVDNPDNHFRRMISSLRMQIGQKEMSFQGATHGLSFSIPFYDNANSENLRIAEYRMKKEARKRIRRLPASIDALQFELKGYQLSTVGQLNLNTNGNPTNEAVVPLPEKVTSYHKETEEKIFVIQKHQFGVWNAKEEKFKALLPPNTLPQLGWPTSLAFDSKRNEVWITSKDGDGYIFAYKPNTKAWRIISPRNGARLIGLTYSPERDLFYGLEESKEIESLLELTPEGQVRRAIQLSKAIPFLKNEWVPELKWKKNRLLLRISKPSSPNGEYFVIDAQKGISRRVFL